MYSIGADACKAGWFALRFREGAEPSYDVFPTAQDLWGAWGTGCDLLLIDVPIGLSDSEPYRGCDAEARRLLGSPRASSVFNPPVRRAVEASSWEEAAAVNEAATGKRISKQGWGIVPKIREVDALLRQDPSLQTVVREVHPEVLFAALNGYRPLARSKKHAAGVDERLRLLERFYPDASELARRALDTFPRKVVQRDDVVDALVAAIVAFRLRDTLRVIPEHPARDSHGLRMEMVVPDISGVRAEDGTATVAAEPLSSPAPKANDKPTRRVASTNELPSRPAVYALYGGSGSGLHVAYVGIGGNLRQRIEQHLVRRDSSITTGTSVVSLNPDLVTRVRWWEHPRFEDRDALLAAEFVAFDVLQPVMRSRGRVTEAARRLCDSDEFVAEMRPLFEHEPTGELRLLRLKDILERLRTLEQRIVRLEGGR